MQSPLFLLICFWLVFLLFNSASFFDKLGSTVLLAGILTIVCTVISFFQPSMLPLAITILKVTGVLFAITFILIAIASNGFKR